MDYLDDGRRWGTTGPQKDPNKVPFKGEKYLAGFSLQLVFIQEWLHINIGDVWLDESNMKMQRCLSFIFTLKQSDVCSGCVMMLSIPESTIIVL